MSALTTSADEQYLRSLMIEVAGIDLGEGRGALLDARLSPVGRSFGLPNLAAIVRALRVGDVDLKNEVVSAMTTNETSWFRDRVVFDGLISTVIPLLLEQIGPSEPLTIWSAASSSGQEVYSLAILLAENFPELVQRKRVRLLATDLVPAMVERCRQARYSVLEMRRGTTEADLERHFTRSGDSWVVNDKLRSMVLCRQLNLTDSLRPVPRCDLVLMRNVLIYFSSDLKTSILHEIKDNVLKPHGALVLGGPELLGNAQEAYKTHNGPGGTYFTPTPV